VSGNSSPEKEEVRLHKEGAKCNRPMSMTVEFFKIKIKRRTRQRLSKFAGSDSISEPLSDLGNDRRTLQAET
jgi:hypothetical protein